MPGIVTSRVKITRMKGLEQHLANSTGSINIYWMCSVRDGDTAEKVVEGKGLRRCWDFWIGDGCESRLGEGVGQL